MLSNNEQLTPVVTRTTKVVGISPLTMASAAQDNNNLGNTSPAGSTEVFSDYAESERGEEQEQELEQPIFDDVGFETPFKNHKPPTSGTTPLGESSFNHRIHRGKTHPM